MSKVEENRMCRFFIPIPAIDREETAGEVFVDGLSVPGLETEAILATVMWGLDWQKYTSMLYVGPRATLNS